MQRSAQRAKSEAGADSAFPPHFEPFPATRRDPETCLAASAALPPKAEILLPTHIRTFPVSRYQAKNVAQDRRRFDQTENAKAPIEARRMLGVILRRAAGRMVIAISWVTRFPVVPLWDSRRKPFEISSFSRL